MAGETNYALIWFIYLLSSAVFYLALWKFTALLGTLLAWLLRTLVAVLIWTPAFPRDEAAVAVPALMAVALDTIAHGPAAAAGSLAALATGLILGSLASLALFVVCAVLKRRQAGRVENPVETLVETLVKSPVERTASAAMGKEQS